MRDEQDDGAANGADMARSDFEQAWIEAIVKHFRARRPDATEAEVHDLTIAVWPWLDKMTTPAIMLAISQVAKYETVDQDGVHDALERAQGTFTQRLEADPNAPGRVLPLRRHSCSRPAHGRDGQTVGPATNWEAVGRLRPTPVETELRQLIVWFDAFRFVSTLDYPDAEEHAAFREVMREYVGCMPWEVLAGATRSCAEAVCVTPGVVIAEVARWYAAHVIEEDQTDADGPPF